MANKKKSAVPECRAHIVYLGRVQGVGFRYTAEQIALELGLTGWVKNLPDGSVEVMAEGESEAMRRFEMALRQGPPAARVEDVDVEELPATGRGGTFLIKG